MSAQEFTQTSLSEVWQTMQRLEHELADARADADRLRQERDKAITERDNLRASLRRFDLLAKNLRSAHDALVAKR